MSVAKVIEIKARSEKSFEDAIAQGIATAADTVEGIREAWVQDQSVSVENGKVKYYNVTVKITFIVN
jgi:hypothetical protein